MVGNELSEEVNIKRGVRQGCVLSPLLFNLYSEDIIQEALEDQHTTGVKVNGKIINNIRYADDTVLLAETLDDLQGLLDQVVKTSEKRGLTLNTKKTKFMTITKHQQQPETLWIKGEPVERVCKYKYLGTTVTDNNEYSEEIRSRIGQARTTFNKMRNVLCRTDLSLHLKIRMLKCYVFPVLLYGMEAWTLKKNDTDRLEAFEMWAYRRILRISWTSRTTNKEVLRRMGKDKEIMTIIKIRKLQYLGHVMRGERYTLLQNILQGKILGKRSIGRRRISWLNNLRQWFNSSSIDLFRAVTSKIKIAMLIANLLKGDGT